MTIRNGESVGKILTQHSQDIYLRSLLNKNCSWHWDLPQEESCLQLKSELTRPVILTHYDPSTETKVSADASSFGLGAVLLQKNTNIWKLVEPCQKQSIVICPNRKKALAAVWACDKFLDYLLGCTFLIETDHKPLVSLLGSKSLDSLPPRILRFRLRLSRFSYSIHHVPGKILYTPDTLSHAPVSTAEERDKQKQRCLQQQELKTYQLVHNNWNLTSLPN